MSKDDRKENLPLNVYLDRLQSFHVIIVDNQPRQNEEYEKHLFSPFRVIDEDYHHQMVMRPIQTNPLTVYLSFFNNILNKILLTLSSYVPRVMHIE
jgi:hypothetical protein